jgi:hypothetical protein
MSDIFGAILRGNMKEFNAALRLASLDSRRIREFFWYAARHNQRDMLKSLASFHYIIRGLTIEPDITNQSIEVETWKILIMSGASPVRMLCHVKDSNVVKFFHECNAVVDCFGNDPLINAYAAMQSDVIQALTQLGACLTPNQIKKSLSMRSRRTVPSLFDSYLRTEFRFPSTVCLRSNLLRVKRCIRF